VQRHAKTPRLPTTRRGAARGAPKSGSVGVTVGRCARSLATTCTGGHVDRHGPINKAAYLLQDKSLGNDLSRRRDARGCDTHENLSHDFPNRCDRRVAASSRSAGGEIVLSTLAGTILTTSPNR
jgi:hypothetical protein